MIKFREKVYSIQDIASNLQASALAAGTISSVILNNKDIIKNPTLQKALLGTSIGIAVLSGLGILADYYSKRKSVNEVRGSINYNLSNVLDILRYDGKVEGKDFFVDPREAESRKVNISIVIRKEVGSMDIIVKGNSHKNDNEPLDKKIKGLVAKVGKKKIDGVSFMNKDSDDKGHEIIATSLNTYFDPGYIADIAKMFIDKKLPVYLLEINR